MTHSTDKVSTDLEHVINISPEMKRSRLVLAMNTVNIHPNILHKQGQVLHQVIQLVPFWHFTVQE